MAFQDTLKHKWDNITPRERALVVLLGVAVPVIILLWMGLEISDRLDAMEKENDKMRRALSTLAEIRARGGPATPTSTVPTPGPDPVKLESYLDKAAQKVGITVSTFKPHTPQSKPNGFLMHTVSFDVNGLTIEQAKDFLETIETDNKLVVVTALEMKRSFSDKEKLDLKLDVSTFSKPAAAGTGTGTGTGTATGTPPAPGAP
jgi:hypothetical protein